MSNLYINITTRSSSPSIEEMPENSAKRIVEQDQGALAKRQKVDIADDIWEFALEDIQNRESVEVAQAEAEDAAYELSVLTQRNPEPQGRLIVEFPLNFLSSLLANLDYSDLGTLFQLCRFTNTTLKSFFLERANVVSQYIFDKPYLNLVVPQRMICQRELDAESSRLAELSILGRGQAFLNDLQDQLSVMNRPHSMAQIRSVFGEEMFVGDEKAFMGHVLSFPDLIESELLKGLVKRTRVEKIANEFLLLKDFLEFMQNSPDEVFAVSEDGSIEIRLDAEELNCHFFPIQLLKNPERLVELKATDSYVFNLPSQIGLCTNLKRLHIEDHLLAFPPEIGQLTQLEYLGFPYAYDIKSFPEEIINLTNLKQLRISEECSGNPCHETKTCASEQCQMYFDDLSPAQKEWLWNLKDNGCEIKGMYIPPRV